MSERGYLNKTLDLPWHDGVLQAGTPVYAYHGHTYGCIGDGVPVSLQPYNGPFIEVPTDSVDWENPCVGIDLDLRQTRRFMFSPEKISDAGAVLTPEAIQECYELIEKNYGNRN